MMSPTFRFKTCAALAFVFGLIPGAVLFVRAEPAPLELLRPGNEPAGPATRRGPYVISEIHYHPQTRADGLNLEFIEIRNTQPWPEDVGGFRLGGEVEFTFPPGTRIPAGGFIVVAGAPADLQTAYGLTGVLGPFSGKLKNEGGELRLRDAADSVVFEVEYGGAPPWPAAPDGAGHTLILARPSLGMGNPRAWDMSALPGGSPGAEEPSAENPWRAVIFNEVQAAGAEDFVELYNAGATAVDLSGCTLSDNPDALKYVFPAGTLIPAQGFLTLNQTQLGFGLKAAGDTVYLRAPGLQDAPGRVLDALRFGPQSPGVSLGRTPDAGPLWSRLTAASPGAANGPALRGDVVISEILYHPPTGSVQPPFVELANRGTAPADVSGWRLSGGVSYEFPAGAVIPAGGFLAVTGFSGSLNQGAGERLVLEMPRTVEEGGIVSTVHVAVDEVTYGTGGRWGQWSDGGGSSLELKDLRADPRHAANWADSDEAAGSQWVTVEATGKFDNSTATANRLHIMMGGAGECLVDDIELRTGAPEGANRIANGTFESGVSGWTFQGTHDKSSLETGAGSGGVNSLHIRAAGRGDNAGNRAFTAITGGVVATNSIVTIRAKVKWLRGHPEILFRINGGGFEATGNILPPGFIAGTPGAANSRAAPDAPPSIAEVTHLPVLPAVNQPVTVYARVSDPDGPGDPVLHYRLDPAQTLTAVPMIPRNAGFYSAEIPGQVSGILAAFHITAGAAGNSSAFPSDAPARECLVRWGEPSPPAANALGTYRLWLTNAVRSLWTSRIPNSNTPLDATFVYGGFRPIYNIGAQYSGSPFHTGGFSGPTGAACDYSLEFPSDDRLLGERDAVLAGPGTFGSDRSLIREQTIWWMARSMPMPALHRRFVNVYVNGAKRQTVFEDTQQPGGEFLKQWFSGDDNGHLHKAQDWIEFADNGRDFQSDTRAVFRNYTTTGGEKKTASYRFMWSKRSVEGSVNDYTDFFALVDAFNSGTGATDPVFTQRFGALADADSWSRALALQRIAGNWDSWGWSYGKNMYIYKPESGPWAMIPWDLDFGLGSDGSGNPPPDGPTSNLFSNTSGFDGGSPGDPLAMKFRNNHTFRRAYWRSLLDAARGPMTTGKVNARIDDMVAGLTANGITPVAAQITAVKSYVAQRRTYILQQAATVAAASWALNGPAGVTSESGDVTFTGTAPPEIRFLRINGIDYEPAWTSPTAWSLPLKLYAQQNALTLEGVGLNGSVIGAGVPVTVEVTAPPAPPPVFINEWMADNVSAFADPADGNFEDWFELYNAGTEPVDLSGFFLTDDPAVKNRWRIPAGTVLAPGGFLVIQADGEIAQNTGPASLHAPFRLSAAGEVLGLYTPDGLETDFVSFAAQSPDVSGGRFRDGGPQRGGGLTVPTPGAANVLTSISKVSRENETVRLAVEAMPGYQYQVQSGTGPGLTGWTSLGNPITAEGPELILEAPAPAGARFFRILTIKPSR